MIIVTGATGQLGRGIVDELLKRVGPDRVGVSVRDPAKAHELTTRGVRVRSGDFADPESLRHSFEGAAQVLIVSSNAAAYGGDTLAQHRSAITAARAAGARRIVYTSHMAASSTSAFPPMRHHAATEAMLAEAGVAWTALRNGFYAESGVGFLGDGLKTGLIEAPEDGPVSWATHADLAEAAAIVLADEGRFDGPTPLTGPEAPTFADLARIASEVLGRPVRHAVLADDELRARLSAQGASPHVANILIGFYAASRNGEFSAVDPTLGQLLGRPPATMRDVLAAIAA